MIKSKNLNTQSTINNIIIGLILSDSCRILRENEVIKLKIRADLGKKNFFLYLYNIIKMLDLDLIYDFWEETDKFLWFSILDNELIKFIFHYFYLDDKFAVIYTEESLDNLEEKKMTTSWNTVIYNTLKNEPQYQHVKKYIPRRFIRENFIINSSSLSYWFMDSGFYDYNIHRYCLVPANFEGTTLLNLLKVLKKELALRFTWDRKNRLLILDRKSEKFLEFYLGNHLWEEFSWKVKNYEAFNKYYEFIIYLIIYFRYLELKEYRRDLDLENKSDNLSLDYNM